VQKTDILVRVVVAGLVIYALASRSEEIRSQLARRDSIAYWTAGQLLRHHSNPYEASSVLELERQQGYQEDKPLVLRTPPWSLFMVLPMGWTNAFSAWLLWISLSLASLVVAMRLCWRMQGGGVPHNLFLLVGYAFAPVPACLVAGQMGLVLLLGVMLFLWFEADRPFLAGAALVLPFAKPHLLVFFWFALLGWVVIRKKYAVAGGFLSALATATAISLVFDPNVFQHYREMLSQAKLGSLFIPAVSGVLRLIFFHRWFWVQFIPMAFGLAWCAWFGFVNRSNWDWRNHGLTVMVVSVLTTPYSWLTDEVVLLPAILQALVCLYQGQPAIRLKTRLVLTLFAGLNGLLLLILAFKIPFSTGIYFWSSLVWFAWYVYGRSFATSRESVKEIGEHR
jgi:hypothetical protein